MPRAHRAHSAGVDGVLAWAASFGPMTEAMVRRLIEANPVREQGWRSARGLRRVAEKYGPGAPSGRGGADLGEVAHLALRQRRCRVGEDALDAFAG